MNNYLRFVRFLYQVHSARVGKDLSLSVINQTFMLAGSVCFFLLHLFSFQLIIGKFSFPGWSSPEMWTLLFTFEIFTYSAFFFFWRGFNHTARDINTGAFDLILSKPAPSQLTAVFRGGGLHNLICLLLGLTGLVFVIYYFHLPVTLANLGLYFIILGLSLWSTYCLGVVLLSFNLRFGHSHPTANLVYLVQEVYKYPATAYSRFSPALWLILSSLSLLTTFPVAILLSKPVGSDLLLLYFGFLVLFTWLSGSAWNSGLRHYSSASS